MTYERLKKILISSNVKGSIIGIILLAMGLGLCLTPFIDDSFKGNTTLLLIFGVLFTGMAVLILVKMLPEIFRAKSDKHPLLRAIKEGKRDYLFWVYKKEIQSTAGHGGPTVGTTNNFVYFPHDSKGKGSELTLSKKDSPDDLLDYLRTHFDIPHIGYADDTRDQVNAHFGLSGAKKV